MKYVFLFGLAATLIACQPEQETDDPAGRPGGATTVFGFFSDAFEQPAANLDALGIEQHFKANQVFEATFVTAPASVNGGLGPLFNQSSCISCHVRNGRAAAPLSSSDLGGLLFKGSIEGVDVHGAPLGIPGFGTQFQNKATFGKTPEVQVSIDYVYSLQQFLDGTEVEVRKPVYLFKNPYTELPASYYFSARIAPALIGMGLLEAIPESLILAYEDPGDADGDGISGRANLVWDVQSNSFQLGRFGWKAGQPNVLQQSAAAYLEDMGITSPLFPNESFSGQPQADTLKDDPEIDEQSLRQAAFYTQSLAVPAARNLAEADVRAGKVLFNKLGCQKCHVPELRTGSSPFAFLAHQTIFPYTDLLLHDMGPALADQRPEFKADGQEWRTPPLWGIGLVKLVNHHTEFLHDGRARSIEEAILWHGGEAQKSQEGYKKLSKTQRQQLIRFIESI